MCTIRNINAPWHKHIVLTVQFLIGYQAKSKRSDYRAIDSVKTRWLSYLYYHRRK